MLRRTIFSSYFFFTAFISITFIACILLSGCDAKEEKTSQKVTNDIQSTATVAATDVENDTDSGDGTLNIPFYKKEKSEEVAIDIYPPNDPEIAEILKKAEKFVKIDFGEITMAELLILTQAIHYCDFNLAQEIRNNFSYNAHNYFKKGNSIMSNSLARIFSIANIEKMTIDVCKEVYERQFDLDDIFLKRLKENQDPYEYAKVLYLYKYYDEAENVIEKASLKYSKDKTVTGTSCTFYAELLPEIYIKNGKYEKAVQFCGEAIEKQYIFDANTVKKLKELKAKAMSKINK